jgi:hypothetical protein
MRLLATSIATALPRDNRADRQCNRPFATRVRDCIHHRRKERCQGSDAVLKYAAPGLSPLSGTSKTTPGHAHALPLELEYGLRLRRSRATFPLRNGGVLWKEGHGPGSASGARLQPLLRQTDRKNKRPRRSGSQQGAARPIAAWTCHAG